MACIKINEPTKLYVVGCERDDGLVGGPCKIGISSNAYKRAKSLQTGNPIALSLCYVFEFESRELALWAESAVHRMLSDLRMEGEWFDVLPGHAETVIVKTTGTNQNG
jgi:hypothetical protein